MYSISGKPLKKASQTCMGHRGVGAPQKNLLKAGCGVVRDFQLVFTCFQPEFDSIKSFYYFFSPESAKNPGIGANKEMYSAPLK